ncbi:GATA zinc finger domain-containing protein [Mycena indigotica]|uniref:GATA zinc finger domain-containing protein n=1 Tax=Mycena indigotica TaxID=2126181 RepID=A0A8H6STB6_9AGAR|nr:GATA zinc finger domain-containing protein [Mycena indigotica]KAF7303987.1 GATA zinc finger domain-containing protein [Mycena indigotica]
MLQAPNNELSLPPLPLSLPVVVKREEDDRLGAEQNLSSISMPPPPAPTLFAPREEMPPSLPSMPILRGYWNDSHERSPYGRMDGMPASPVAGLVGLPNGHGNGRYSPPSGHHRAPIGNPRPHSNSAAATSSPNVDFSGLLTMHDLTSASGTTPAHGNPSSSSAGRHFRPSDDWLTNGGPHGSHGWPGPNPSLYDDKWSRYERSSSSTTTPSDSASPSSYFMSPMNGTPTLPPMIMPPHPNPPAPRRQSQNGQTKKECFHCHATSTPLWRREPQTQRPLCNACGLYLQQRNKLRPQELIDADRDDYEDNPVNRIPDEEYTGPKCSHCGTRQTSVWRRSKTGQQVCNACGVYQRLKGKERPLSLRRNKVRPRTKHTTPSS